MSPRYLELKAIWHVIGRSDPNPTSSFVETSLLFSSPLLILFSYFFPPAGEQQDIAVKMVQWDIKRILQVPDTKYQFRKITVSKKKLIIINAPAPSQFTKYNKKRKKYNLKYVLFMNKLFIFF